MEGESSCTNINLNNTFHELSVGSVVRVAGYRSKGLRFESLT